MLNLDKTSLDSQPLQVSLLKELPEKKKKKKKKKKRN
jgi:hypothetical protein